MAARYEDLYSYENGILTLNVGVADVHGHPRAFDEWTPEELRVEQDFSGKAGLPVYTETALKSGITVVSAMPNEFMREYDPETGESRLVPFPISTRDKTLMMEHAIATQSRIRMSYHFGLDPKRVITEEGWVDSVTVLNDFKTGARNASALKIYGDITTGGNNIPVDRIPEVASMWSAEYPTKPVIMHLEDENVARVLEEISRLPNGNEIKIHIAHVSSRQELEAIIQAKDRGMDVTCEVTPHHLFTNADEGSQIGGYGCMKPSLKTPEDVQFLWDNLDYIDIIASDCAPHKTSDKEGDDPAYGVTNHTMMIQLLLGAVEEGRMTLDQFIEKTVLNPRERFNLGFSDKTSAIINLNEGYDNPSDIERIIIPRYGENIFLKLEQQLGKTVHLAGHVVFAESGSSRVREHDDKQFFVPNFKVDLRHLVKVGG